jgi:hypothetical protein
MVSAPEENKRRAAVRVVIEMFAQATPITAGLAHLYGFTHPTEMERALEAWREEVSNTLNDHEAKLKRIEALTAPRLLISETALAVAVWLTEQSRDGLCTGVMFDVVASTFADVPKSELEEACFELRHLRLVSTSAAIGRAILSIRPEYALFWAFDSTVLKTNPNDDAVELANLMLEDSSLESIRRLHERVGWARRRLNPAIARLMPMIADGRTSHEIQNQYPTTSFSLISEDRFQLRRFVQDAAATR